MAGAITVVEATTMDGVEAIIVVITIGETSLPLMLIVLGGGRFWAAFLWSCRDVRLESVMRGRSGQADRPSGV
jgi:hypothetical protein